MFWNKAILMSSELTLSFPCRTAHLKRRNKINPNLFSFIIHDFTPGYTYVSTNINSSLVISGLNYWFATIRGPSLPVFTSCRSYSDPHDAFIFLWPYGVQIQLVKAVEKVCFLALLFLQPGQENYLRRCSCKYQKIQDHLEREEKRQRLSPFTCRVILYNFNYIVETPTLGDLFWDKVLATREMELWADTQPLVWYLWETGLLGQGFHQRQCYPDCCAAKQLQSGFKNRSHGSWIHIASSAKADCSSHRQNKFGSFCKILDRHPKKKFHQIFSAPGGNNKK